MGVGPSGSAGLGECEPGLLVVLILADALEVPPHTMLDGLPVTLADAS